MHSSDSLLLLLLLAATMGPAGALSDDEKRVMVELHNLYRAQAFPPAADMLLMVSVAGGGGARLPAQTEGALSQDPPQPLPPPPG